MKKRLFLLSLCLLILVSAMSGCGSDAKEESPVNPSPAPEEKAVESSDADDYEAATGLFNEGKYAEAALKFEALGDYEAAPQMKNDAEFLAAVSEGIKYWLPVLHVYDTDEIIEAYDDKNLAGEKELAAFEALINDQYKYAEVFMDAEFYNPELATVSNDYFEIISFLHQEFSKFAELERHYAAFDFKEFQLRGNEKEKGFDSSSDQQYIEDFKKTLLNAAEILTKLISDGSFTISEGDTLIDSYESKLLYKELETEITDLIYDSLSLHHDKTDGVWHFLFTNKTEYSFDFILAYTFFNPDDFSVHETNAFSQHAEPGDELDLVFEHNSDNSGEYSVFCSSYYGNIK